MTQSCHPTVSQLLEQTRRHALDRKLIFALPLLDQLKERVAVDVGLVDALAQVEQFQSLLTEMQAALASSLETTARDQWLAVFTDYLIRWDLSACEHMAAHNNALETQEATLAREAIDAIQSGDYANRSVPKFSESRIEVTRTRELPKAADRSVRPPERAAYERWQRAAAWA